MCIRDSSDKSLEHTHHSNSVAWKAIAARYVDTARPMMARGRAWRGGVMPDPFYDHVKA